MADQRLESGVDPAPFMRYFGEKWNSPMLADAIECERPSGVCMHCNEGFKDDDSGWIYPTGYAVHVECGLRQVLGGVNHQLGQCTCHGGTLEPDPPGLTVRQAALAAFNLYLLRERMQG